MKESPLQIELGKRRPFDSAEQEASLNIVRTQDYLHGHFAQLLETAGISGPQYNVLRILRGHGAGVPTQTIASQMLTRMPDITRLIDRLEQAGFAQRSRTPHDRRVVLVKITRTGLDLLARLDEPVLDLHHQLLGHLTKAELQQLNALLVKARRPPEAAAANGGRAPTKRRR
jgi:DNA-binding MarR family transcriptional regulator